MKHSFLNGLLLLWCSVQLSSCASIPPGGEPVTGFDVNRYLGTWYEIARLDHSFERGLSRVTATYTLADDGTVDVLNKGYKAESGEWKSAKGRARFRGDRNIAALEVSFFGPFYSGYNVLALDDDYRYALVAGKDLNYLWILSRSRDIPQQVKNNFLEKAREIGYATDALLWIEQGSGEGKNE